MEFSSFHCNEQQLIDSFQAHLFLFLEKFRVWRLTNFFSPFLNKLPASSSKSKSCLFLPVHPNFHVLSSTLTRPPPTFTIFPWLSLIHSTYFTSFTFPLTFPIPSHFDLLNCPRDMPVDDQRVVTMFLSVLTEPYRSYFTEPTRTRHLSGSES